MTKNFFIYIPFYSPSTLTLQRLQHFKKAVGILYEQYVINSLQFNVCKVHNAFNIDFINGIDHKFWIIVLKCEAQ